MGDEDKYERNQITVRMTEAVIRNPTIKPYIPYNTCVLYKNTHIYFEWVDNTTSKSQGYSNKTPTTGMRNLLSYCFWVIGTILRTSCGFSTGFEGNSLCTTDRGPRGSYCVYDTIASSLGISFHGIKGAMQSFKEGKQPKVSPNYEHSNDQHDMISLRDQQWYAYFDGNQQLSNWILKHSILNHTRYLKARQLLG